MQANDLSRYRASPGGMASVEGVDEMCRFGLGEPNAIIADAMGFSEKALQNWRRIWKDPNSAGYKGPFHSSNLPGAR